MKLSRFITFAIILALSLTAVPGYPAEPDWPAQLRFLSGPPGGSWFTLGTELSGIWTGDGLPKTTSYQGGGVSNILNVHAKRADLAFSVTSLFNAALKGEADFKGRSVDNVVIMTNLYSQYTYFIMRKDFAVRNKITSVEDIIDKKLAVRFATLRPGTSSELVIKALFDKAYGLDYKKALQDWGGSVEYVSYDGGADLLADNHVDCFAFSVSKSASVIMKIEKAIDIVLLQVSQTALDKLSEAYGTFSLTIEPGTYKSLPKDSEPVRAIGDYTCIIARNDLPDSLLQSLVKSIKLHSNKLTEAVKDTLELTQGTAE
ncbi:MAG: TAXI family TRAP transporter solute-binding subunit [Synergistaceae bacterium]|nr:TAXI family TRAP transporter solute-binding subunit [Synergistaceae bacterium]